LQHPDSFVLSELGNRYPDLIQICARCKPETQVIQRPTHKMIRRFVSVRAVKAWRRFGFKIASFHVSIALVSFLYLSLSVLFICYLYHFMWLS